MIKKKNIMIYFENKNEKKYKELEVRNGNVSKNVRNYKKNYLSNNQTNFSINKKN